MIHTLFKRKPKPHYLTLKLDQNDFELVAEVQHESFRDQDQEAHTFREKYGSAFNTLNLFML